MYEYLIPALLAGTALLALVKKEQAYDHLIVGAAEGLKMLRSIAPSLVVLLSAISALRACGAMEAAASFLSPAASMLGIPPETLPLVLIRPLSGSAALAMGTELMTHYGVDSLIGRTAAVMLGSTETTFYVISVYFGACGITKTRYALPAALCADLAGFVAASWSVRFFYP